MADRYITVVVQNDTVATAIREVDAGESVEIAVGDESRTITITEDIPFGHKIALEPIGNGDQIYKYGLSIGTASQDIEPGEWVHVHNIESNYGRGDLAAEEAKAGGTS